MGLYTIGYSSWDYEQMIAALKGLGVGVKIYDVRYRPASRRPEFSRKRLAERLGKRYVHAQGLGNVDYKSDNIRLADPEPWYAEIAEHLASGKPAVLLCACARLDVCHRLVIARELEKRLGIKAEHMTPKRTSGRKKAKSEHTRSLFE
jgi:uncharacterized protein (DUF488 family)